MSKQLEGIIEGLSLIAEVEPDAQLYAEHDVIYVGGAINKYTAEQSERLGELGFIHDLEGSESFGKFV